MLIIDGKEWKKGTILENAHSFFANNWQIGKTKKCQIGKKFFVYNVSLNLY